MGKLMVSETHIQFGIRSQVDWESREEASARVPAWAGHLPYLPHFRLLLKRADSFFLPPPWPVHTSAISHMQKGLEGSKPHLGGSAHWAQGSQAVGVCQAFVCRPQALPWVIAAAATGTTPAPPGP